MRVGLILYGSLNTTSGGYLYDRQLVQHLRNAGDEVEIVSLPWRNYAQHLTDNFAPEWRRRLRAGRWDVLLQDELNHPSLFHLNRWLRPRVRYPFISIVHHLRCSERRPRWQNALYRMVERAYLRSVDGLVFNSETTKRTVEASLTPLPPLPKGEAKPGVRVKTQPSLTAYPAADHIRPTLTLAQIEQRALQPGPLRLLFVGNLIPRKGLHTLLGALARLGGDWQLRVVGNLAIDPAYTRAIRAQIARLRLGERVTLLGALSEADLRAQLAAHHLLAVPSSYEGYGIVYLEAMAFGLPVIGTTAGAAWEIITPARDGYLVPPEDPDALASALASLLADRLRLRAMSRAAREGYERQPTWSESMAAIRTFLVEIAAATAGV